MQPTMKQLYVMYAQKLQEVRNVNKPPLIADMLGIARKGNGTIRLTIKE